MAYFPQRPLLSHGYRVITRIFHRGPSNKCSHVRTAVVLSHTSHTNKQAFAPLHAGTKATGTIRYGKYGDPTVLGNNSAASTVTAAADPRSITSIYIFSRHNKSNEAFRGSKCLYHTPCYHPPTLLSHPLQVGTWVPVSALFHTGDIILDTPYRVQRNVCYFFFSCQNVITPVCFSYTTYGITHVSINPTSWIPYNISNTT